MKLSGKTKAEVIEILKSKSRSFEIEDFFHFTVVDWRVDSRNIVTKIQKKFNCRDIVVRSSASNEDSESCSMAGYYTSCLGVPVAERKQIRSAIETVVNSYRKAGICDSKNQILVQSQTTDVVSSGVVFTRHMGTNAPYYIINYDELTGNTDTVTSGLSSKLVIVSRFVEKPYQRKWAKLLEAVKEIEEIFSAVPLDIEFAITKDEKVVIFQTRPLTVNIGRDCQQDLIISRLIGDMKTKFKRFNRRVAHLGGSRTIYGDMPDWNPAEIIGERPNTLDYTLYRFLVTDNVWHEARTSLGYTDVFPGELMTSFARKPYIDTRLSFNSLVPAAVPFSVRDKLVDYYLKKLENRPELQDKVEFDILWTCYDLSVEQNIKEILAYGFTENDIELTVSALKGLTEKIILDSREIFDADLTALEELAHRRQQVLASMDHSDVEFWELISATHYILTSCKKFGTYPFSRLARLAFIAKSILRSLEHNGIIDDDFYDSVMLSVHTIAKEFSSDCKKLRTGTIHKEAFREKYGHLRAGTYDIISKRYDQQVDFIKIENDINVEHGPNRKTKLHIPERTAIKITRAMKTAGLDVEAVRLIDFICKALEYRELSKFEFTKSLSDSIELLAIAGEKIGVHRKELCHCDFMLLMKLRNIEVNDVEYVRERILRSIERHRNEKQWFDNIILPPVIRDEKDFDYIEFYQSRPNFITSKKIQGEVAFLNKNVTCGSNNIADKILLIENADPGYDWIFTQNPLGLITKYGGAASHMAIRCAEFGIPAAIGCGEILFSKVLEHNEVAIDCKNKKLTYRQSLAINSL
jgi:hypothetical protein